MIRLAIAILALALVGCGSRTRLNPGADLAIYQGSTAHMHETLPAGVDHATTTRLGYYSPSDGSITLHEQLRGLAAARVLAHELAHAYDHQKPRDIWELLIRYQAPGFDFNLHPEQRDVVRAIKVSRRAQESKP